MRHRYAIALAQLALLSTATAHHSPAAQFDLAERVTLTGIVSEYRFVNPHALIFLDSVGADGSTERWIVEGADPNALRRLGWTGREIDVGDEVTIVGNPSRDGSNSISWQSITVAGKGQLAGGNGSFIFAALQARWRRYAAAGGR